MSTKFVNRLEAAETYTHTHTHTHTCSLLPSLKQIGTICFLSIISISPIFADDEPTLIPTPASCNNSVLNTTEGSAALEAIYTPNTINTQWYTGYGANGQAASPTTCSYDGTINLPATNPTRPGYAFNGWKLRAPQCTIPVTDINTATTSGAVHGWHNNADYCYSCTPNCGIANCSTVSDLSLNQWKVSWSNGDVVRGIASCQSSAPSDILYFVTNVDLVVDEEMDAETFLSEYTALAGQEKGAIAQQALTAYLQWDFERGKTLSYPLLSIPGSTNYTTNSTGEYCFCQATHYTANNAQQCSLSSPSWVFIDFYENSAANCAQDCAFNCVRNVRRDSGFRAALFGGNIAQ